jgi:FSR family fosmidomycin resistance protein-like MFS transporter
VHKHDEARTATLGLVANSVSHFLNDMLQSLLPALYPVLKTRYAGALPFTLLLPFANFFWTAVLSGVIGLVIASAFSAILVFAQELVPGRVGQISGLFFGLAFGMSGLGAALLGQLADRTSIEFVFQLSAFLPALGLLAGFLPSVDPIARRK